jgi:hypothetical protein
MAPGRSSIALPDVNATIVLSIPIAQPPPSRIRSTP